MTDDRLTRILREVQAGDAGATEQLLPLVYEELRKLAGRKMSREAVSHTLQPTALVHEAYLRLVGQGAGQSWQNRGHFYAAAAEAMRRILIERARRKATHKRGGLRKRVPLGETLAESADGDDLVLVVDEALQRLEVVDPDSAKLVKLRYFTGLTIEEAAAALGISPRTARRIWTYARAWLQREIESD